MYSQQQQSTHSTNNNNNIIKHIRAMDLPEIRIAIAAFLHPRHCVPCLLVCKAWYPEFLSRIWRSPNLYPYPITPKNSHFSAALVAKHGHLIQEVGPLFSGRQFSYLVDASLTSLRSITIHQLRTLPDKEAFDKVLLRQKQLGVRLKLEEFKSQGNILDADKFTALGIFPFSSQARMPLGYLSPSSMTTNSLRSLRLEKMNMDHNVFLDILRYSSHLTHLSLAKIVFVSSFSYSLATSPPFVSPSVRTLTATIHQVLHIVDPDLPDLYPPLLAHFPNLTTWNISLLDFLDIEIKPTIAHALHHAVNTYSLLLTDLEFRWGTTGLASNLLVGAFSGVRIRKVSFTNGRSRSTCRFDAMMPGILKHADSLVSISLSNVLNLNINEPITPPLSPHMDASGTAFVKLMQTCPHLQILSIPDYIASIEAIEHCGEWACCKGLETLRVSVQGLDGIASCLTKLKDLRNSDTWRSSSGVMRVNGNTVGDRVIQKLIGLRRLKTVSLNGAKDVFLGTC